MKRRWLAYVLLALAMLVGLAGCNGSRPYAAPSESATGAQTSPTPRATALITYFPKHDEPLRTDRGNEYFFGELVALDGCLRLDYGVGYFEGLTLLLVWPPGFSVSEEDGSITVVDGYGSTAAKLGEDVRFSGRAFGEDVWPVYADEPGQDQPQARLRWREQLKEWQQVEQEWQQRLSVDCPGPFLMVGDEVTVVGPDEPTVVSTPGSTLFFPRSKSIRGPKSSHLLLGTGELVLDGNCLRLGHGNERAKGALIQWPAGFAPYIEGGEVEIRNGAGRTIARVGDSIEVSGQRGRHENSPYGASCPGSLWYVESRIENLTTPLQEYR